MSEKQKDKSKNNDEFKHIIWLALFVAFNFLIAYIFLEFLYNQFMIRDSHNHHNGVISSEEAKERFYYISTAVMVWSAIVIILYLKGSKIIRIIGWVYSVLALGVVQGFISIVDAMLGRPLRIKGKYVVADIEEGEGWSEGESPNISGLDEDTCAALEALWLQNARGEYAGIPAFSRISIQLASLGAPAKLIQWSHKAAMDEIKHTSLCFAMAEGYGKRAYKVKPMPELLDIELKSKTNIIQVLIEESVVDGCLLEMFFSDVASESARECNDLVVKKVFEQIAEDEKSHADFSWEILKWAKKSEPYLVYSVVKGIITELNNCKCPRAVHKECDELVSKAGKNKLLKNGILPQERWSEIWQKRLSVTKQQLEKMIENKIAA